MIDHYFVSFVLGFIGGSFSDPHNQGNFGPFQICYDYGISVCGGGGPFKTRGKENGCIFYVLSNNLSGYQTTYNYNLIIKF